MEKESIKGLWHSLPLASENDMRMLEEQIDLHPEVWETAGVFLRDTDLAALPLGRNEVGAGCFANVQEYNTKLESKYELHRRYIDVQLLTSGEELVYVADREDAREPQGEFNTKNDFILYASATKERKVTVSPESWLILYPTDAHMPCMAIDGVSRPVRKIVVKIPQGKTEN